MTYLFLLAIAVLLSLQMWVVFCSTLGSNPNRLVNWNVSITFSWASNRTYPPIHQFSEVGSIKKIRQYKQSIVDSIPLAAKSVLKRQNILSDVLNLTYDIKPNQTRLVSNTHLTLTLEEWGCAYCFSSLHLALVKRQLQLRCRGSSVDFFLAVIRVENFHLQTKHQLHISS